jgi:tetratricopeptide (TPR) repeat protein
MFERAMAASQSRKLAALLNQRGTCLALIGERSKAISDLDEAVISDKNYAPAFNNRAWMLAQAPSRHGNVNKAMTSPKWPEAYDTRGTIYLALKQYEQARKTSFDSNKEEYAEVTTTGHSCTKYKAMKVNRRPTKSGQSNWATLFKDNKVFVDLASYLKRVLKYLSST